MKLFTPDLVYLFLKVRDSIKCLKIVIQVHMGK